MNLGNSPGKVKNKTQLRINKATNLTQNFKMFKKIGKKVPKKN